MQIVTLNYAEIQKVKSIFAFENSISSTRMCKELRFFEPRFASLDRNDLRICTVVVHDSLLKPGVEQAVGQGGRMPLQISMQGGENRSLPSHFSTASLPVVRLKFGEN